MKISMNLEAYCLKVVSDHSLVGNYVREVGNLASSNNLEYYKHDSGRKCISSSSLDQVIYSI
jgi:hypothetical protein